MGRQQKKFRKWGGKTTTTTNRAEEMKMKNVKSWKWSSVDRKETTVTTATQQRQLSRTGKKLKQRKIILMLLSFWFSILNINVYKLFDGQIKYWHKLRVRFKASIGWAWTAMCSNILYNANTKPLPKSVVKWHLHIFKSIRSWFSVHVMHCVFWCVFFFVPLFYLVVWRAHLSVKHVTWLYRRFFLSFLFCIISYRYLYDGRSAESVHCDLCISKSLWVKKKTNKKKTELVWPIANFKFFMRYNITVMILSSTHTHTAPEKVVRHHFVHRTIAKCQMFIYNDKVLFGYLL